MAKTILKTVAGAGLGLLVGGPVGAIGGAGAGLLSGPAKKLTKKLVGGKDKPAAPEVTPPTQPLPDDEAIRRARKATLLKRQGAGGRSSTILTGGETLGGY